ncbi:MAG: protein translocase subunit SecF [Candidatus Andersenbacteria bacterium CG10_big_fil_rev_8_21_14_0_10_54_11]|uniref:Protein-export membrane protein SecF n=1 Tax=Candidatus Andersenbacteria bacterium CG10_big_fil_rev_8_21_14_0_10_54_11 TaxID=1974485 RepID=A0A2M6WYI5_9BACT|nr:MAG: protein translocase subunit SecF [Candidatus Andersenbacteria bacterium CG10_big_fil_rev_8_21_14_0_10_54_11]
MIRRIRLWNLIAAGTITGGITVTLIFRPVLGIDFTGGTLLEVGVQVSTADLRAAAEKALDAPVTVQATDGGRFLIRTAPLTEAQHQAVLSGLEEAGIVAEELRFESIGPTIGQELRRKAAVASGLVVIALVLYLAYTFRQSSRLLAPWKFGIAAVYALLHDLIVVTALFSFLGHFAGAPIDTLFVTAMLALMGYSVNDTIVIFNRLRSEWRQAGSGGLLDTLDRAVRLSLVRSLNTSLTTLLVLLALLLFGGSTLRWFIVALTAGTIVGTYSSFFVAPPLLYALAKRSPRGK